MHYYYPGEFGCPSPFGICAESLDNLAADQWSENNKINDNCSSDIANITIKTE